MISAVIDIGTNTLILLVVKTSGKKITKVLEDRAVITRLGQGLTEDHFFGPEAMNRTIKVLHEFKDTCEKLKVKKIKVVGTAACRIAANARVFLDRVKKECGFKVDVISGDKEALYTFASAWCDFKAKHKKLIVVDIGGGSTEIITGPHPKKKDSPQTVISLHMGSVRMTEQYVKHDPITGEEFHRLSVATQNDIKDDLDDFYPESFNPAEYTLVATAGTATTLCAIDKKLKKYNPEKIQGAWLKKENLEQILQTLIRSTVKERRELPGMEPLRADVILAGALLLYEIMNYFKQTKALISDKGLRYGVLYEEILK